MTIQTQVSAFGALLLFQSEREVNRNKGQALPVLALSLSRLLV